jgi:hypothetical protein
LAAAVFLFGVYCARLVRDMELGSREIVTILPLLFYERRNLYS